MATNPIVITNTPNPMKNRMRPARAILVAVIMGLVQTKILIQNNFFTNQLLVHAKVSHLLEKSVSIVSIYVLARPGYGTTKQNMPRRTEQNSKFHPAVDTTPFSIITLTKFNLFLFAQKITPSKKNFSIQQFRHDIFHIYTTCFYLFIEIFHISFAHRNVKMSFWAAISISFLIIIVYFFSSSTWNIILSFCLFSLFLSEYEILSQRHITFK